MNNTTSSTASTGAQATSREVTRLTPAIREVAYWVSGCLLAVVLGMVAQRTQGTAVALVLGLTALVCSVGAHWIGLKRQQAVAEFRREQGEA